MIVARDSAIRELARRRETERYRYFTPNGKQTDFIKMFSTGMNFIDIFSGANGAGKSYLMVNILANLIWGPSSSWFDTPLFRRWPYPKKIRLGVTSENMKDGSAIDDAINHFWPKGKFEGVKAGRPSVSQYRTSTGWTVDKMSFEQETREWESATLGLIAFDEPPPKEVFAASVARTRRGGKIAFFMTPLMVGAWVIDELLDSENKAGVVYADIEDNCKVHGVRGSLDHADIEKMIHHMDPDEVEARAHGKPMHLSSVIFGKAFDRARNVIPDDDPIPAGSQMFHVVDPARGKPWAMAWGCVTPSGLLIFEREYPEEDWTRCRETTLTLPDYAEVIRLAENGKGVMWRILDRHFGNQRNDYGRTLKQELSDKFGLEFRDSYAVEEEVETGIQKVKDCLIGDAALGPTVKIKARCRNIIRAMERWNRDPRTLKPNPLSVYKDHADLVRYACMAGLEVEEIIPLKPRPPVYALGRL